MDGTCHSVIGVLGHERVGTKPGVLAINTQAFQPTSGQALREQRLAELPAFRLSNAGVPIIARPAHTKGCAPWRTFGDASRAPKRQGTHWTAAKDLMLLLAIVCLFASAIYWWGRPINPNPR